MSALSYRELKKNELLDMVLAVLGLVKKKKQIALSLIGTLAGIVIFLIFVFSRVYQMEARVSDKLSLGQALLRAGQTDPGLNLINEVIGRFPKSKASFIARLTKADLLLTQRKFNEAKELSDYVIKNANPETLKPLAYTQMGNIQENMGDFNGAIETYNIFLRDYPDSYLFPKILESLGRSYEYARMPEQAKNAYERIVTAYKGTVWEKNAMERLYYISAVSAK